MVNVQRYPDSDEILIRTDYFAGSPSEGIFLIIGKDQNNKEYLPRSNKKLLGEYTLPSGTIHTLEKGIFPAIPFTYKSIIKLRGTLREEINLKVFDEFEQIVKLDREVEFIFKNIIKQCVDELEMIQPANYFWGEFFPNRDYRGFERLECFLEKCRGI